MKIQNKIIAEIVVVLALSYALNLIVLFRMPQGGSVTVVSMVPILWLALRRGTKIGVLAGVIFGLVDLMPQPFVVHPVQFLLDYPLAFGSLGLAGLFQKHPIAGVVTGIFGRFVCHFVSGIVFFAMYAPAGMNPVVYSRNQSPLAALSVNVVLQPDILGSNLRLTNLSWIYFRVQL